MTLDQIKNYMTVLDLPSGVVLGIHTLVMIGLSIIAVVFHKDIPTTVITIFGMVLGGFCVHKTTTAVVSTSTTNVSESKEGNAQ